MTKSAPVAPSRRKKVLDRLFWFRSGVQWAGLAISFVIQVFLIHPRQPAVWTADDWVFFVVGWMPLLVAFIGSQFIPPRAGVFCDHCGKYVRGYEQWICGYCNRLNDTRRFWMRCKTCRRPPLALRCPWCHRPIFLDDVEDETNCARCANEDRPRSDLQAIVRQVETRASTLRLKTINEGSHVQMLLFVDTVHRQVEIRWFARSTVREPLTVEGCQGNKALFRQSGWEGSHTLLCPPGEHLIRLLSTASGSNTKSEDVIYRLEMPEAPQQQLPAPSMADRVAAAIAELEQLTLTPLALDEWAIKKERELRERWTTELPADEVTAMMARFRGSIRIARQRIVK